MPLHSKDQFISNILEIFMSEKNPSEENPSEENPSEENPSEENPPNYEEVENLVICLKAVNDINTANEWGVTLLSWAATFGKKDIVKAILDNHGTLENENNRNFLDIGSGAPLQLAAENNHWEIVDALLSYAEKEVDVEGSKKYIDFECTTFNAPALHFAALKGSTQTAEVLLKHYANPYITDDFGDTPAHIAAQKGHHEIIDMLVKYEVNINIQNCKTGNTPLHIAIEQNKLNVVEALLKHGANVTIIGEDGYTPINIAAQMRNPEIIKLLLKHIVENRIGSKYSAEEIEVPSKILCLEGDAAADSCPDMIAAGEYSAEPMGQGIEENNLA